MTKRLSDKQIEKRMDFVVEPADPYAMRDFKLRYAYDEQQPAITGPIHMTLGISSPTGAEWCQPFSRAVYWDNHEQATLEKMVSAYYEATGRSDVPPSGSQLQQMLLTSFNHSQSPFVAHRGGYIDPTAPWAITMQAADMKQAQAVLAKLEDYGVLPLHHALKIQALMGEAHDHATADMPQEISRPSTKYVGSLR